MNCQICGREFLNSEEGVTSYIVHDVKGDPIEIFSVIDFKILFAKSGITAIDHVILCPDCKKELVQWLENRAQIIQGGNS